jgi:hypothetical protein
VSRRKRRPGRAAAGSGSGPGARPASGSGAEPGAPAASGSGAEPGAPAASGSGAEPGAPAASGSGPGARGRARAGRPSEPASARRVAPDVAILIAVFAVAVGVAELAGAANLGVAFGVGQVAFALALVALLLRE